MAILTIIYQMIMDWQERHNGELPNIIIMSTDLWFDFINDPIGRVISKEYQEIITSRKIQGISILWVSNDDYLYVGEISNSRRV